LDFAFVLENLTFLIKMLADGVTETTLFYLLDPSLLIHLDGKVFQLGTLLIKYKET